MERAATRERNGARRSGAGGPATKQEMAGLRIYDRRERRLVAAADALLSPIALARRFRGGSSARPARVLCFRLERIGDLLMTLPALSALRAALPDATIDLVTGSWNRAIAAAVPGIDRVETMDAAWLARGGDAPGVAGLARRAAGWRSRGYDLAINFEPDIRTNLVMAAVGARRTAGFASGGGGAVLDVALDYDPSAHTADNALRLVEAAVGVHAPPEGGSHAIAPVPLLEIPDAARAEAAALLRPFDERLKIGVHVSGGRAIKQWPEERFRDVAVALVRDRGASIVLTGTPAERAQLAMVRDALPADRVLDLSESVDLLTVAAVLQQLDLMVTGDTGPMHLAHAVGTPIVAIFGPSDPARYAPRGLRDRIVRIDLPCSPCNRIRLPPARCVGHTPDCLAGVETASVLAAVDDVLDGGRT
jgi:ADP-heptose:LPS heptosyltransferase